MSLCKNSHRHLPEFGQLPHDQGGHGRHKCAGCAYELGYEAGLSRTERLHTDLDSLPGSQAGTVRHKSPHAAYAKGYYDGVAESYRS